MRPIAATIYPQDGRGAKVVFDEPCMAPSPGQACVAYSLDEELCLGGGWFEKTMSPAEISIKSVFEN